MTRRRFLQLDVFGSAGGRGNPLAVVLDAEGLSSAQMQDFAAWTNLSETTFLLPPDVAGADYRVRIFTTSRELPFAGHPTLGSCAAWLHAGGRPGDPDGQLRQQCAAGTVLVRRQDDGLAFAAPPLTRSGPVEPGLRERVRAGLGIAAADVLECVWLVNGPGWIGVRLPTAEQVLALTPDPTALRGLDVGVVGPWPAGSECQLEVRGFAAEGGTLVEDPATGSLNAGVGQWLTGSGFLPASYTAAQGTVLGRAGRVRVSRVGDEVWVGGRADVVVEGTVEL